MTWGDDGVRGPKAEAGSHPLSLKHQTPLPWADQGQPILDSP